MGKLNEAKNMKPEYQEILEEKKNINNQNKGIFKKVVIENNKDKLVEDNKDLEKCKTITDYKNVKEMAELSKKTLQDRKKKLKKDFAKVVATGAMIFMLIVGARNAIKTKNNQPEFTGKQSVYSNKLPDNQVQEGAPKDLEVNPDYDEKGNPGSGGSGGSGKTVNPNDKIVTNNTIEDTLENNNVDANGGNSQGASLQSDESIEANKEQQADIDKRQQNPNDKVQQQGKGSSTIKTENPDEVKEFENKNKINHSFQENYNKNTDKTGEYDLNQDQKQNENQTFKKLESEEHKKKENKATTQDPAPKVNEENLTQSDPDALRAAMDKYASKQAKNVEGPSR